MTATKTAHVTFLVDRSGSMASIRDDVIGGFNQFLRDQQAGEGQCLLTVRQFDTQGFDTLFSGMDVEDVRDAQSSDFQPRGGTPLYDAIGKAIMHAQARTETAEGRNEQPIIVILTDGQENSSREYSLEAVRKLIEAKHEQGWVFTFLGANIDAYAVGQSFSVPASAVQNFVADSAGTKVTFLSVSAAVSDSRSRMRRGKRVSSADFYENTGTAAQDDWASRSPAAGRSGGVSPTTPRSWSKSGK